MDAIAREGESGIAVAAGLEFDVHRRMDVDDLPAVGFLRDEPFGIFVEDLVVAFEGLFVFVAAGGERLAFYGNGIEDRWRDVDYGCAGGGGFFAEFQNAFAKFSEAVFGEGIVDAVVHAIAGEDEVGLDLGEGAIEAFVEVGSRELAAGVAGFGKAGNGFAGEAEIDDVEFEGWILAARVGFEEFNVFPAVGDAVAEEKNAARAGDFLAELGFEVRWRHGHEADLANVHDGGGFFVLRFDGEREFAGFPEMDAAELSRDETLEMAGFIDDEIEILSGDFDANVAAAIAFAAALPDFQIVNARAIDAEFPVGPIVRAGPVAEAVFVCLRFVAKHLAVDGRFAGVEQNFFAARGATEKKQQK